MCTVIHNFENSRLLLCPTEKNTTQSSPGPSPSVSVPSPSESSPVEPSPVEPSPTESVPSPSESVPSPTESVPSPVPSPVHSPCVLETLVRHCDCSSVSSPTPSSPTSPTPSSSTTNQNTLTGRDWLHVLWCLPVFLIVYICYKRHCWKSIKVGITRRRYEMRSQSWPRHVMIPHPAAASRSKSESFDTIVV